MQNKYRKALKESRGMVKNMKKYRTTGNVIAHNGICLRQIVATRSFGDVRRGQLGGWIEKEENLSHEGNCWVYQEAKVFGDACVTDNSIVKGAACVSGHAVLKGSSVVTDNSIVTGYTEVEDSIICGDTVLDGFGIVTESFVDTVQMLNAEVFNSSINNASITDANINNICIGEDADIRGNSDIITITVADNTYTFYSDKYNGVSVYDYQYDCTLSLNVLEKQYPELSNIFKEIQCKLRRVSFKIIRGAV